MTAFHDGKEYWLADGYHRWYAAEAIGAKEIAATIHQGTRRDATLFAVGANAVHGLRRTNEDKRRSVLTLLRDEEWGQWPETKIAEICKVSRPLVRALIQENPHLVEKQHKQLREVTRGGTTYTMHTGNIGRSREPSLGLVSKPEPMRAPQ